MRNCWDWLIRVKIVPKAELQEFYEQLEETKKEKEEAQNDIQSALELAEEAEKVAEETRKERAEVETKLRVMGERVQKVTLKLEMAQLELKKFRSKDMGSSKGSKQKVVILGGSPHRKETVDRIQEEWEDFDIEWFPSEKNGKSKGWLKSLSRKIRSTDLLLVVRDCVGHSKQDSALKVCRNNGSPYKIIPTLSYETVGAALCHYQT